LQDRTLPPERVEEFAMQASEKAAQEPTFGRSTLMSTTSRHGEGNSGAQRDSIGQAGNLQPLIYGGHSFRVIRGLS
jgi:hypothetical protein